MERFASWFLRLDRRYVYLLIAVVLTFPLLRPFNLPIVPTDKVKNIYDYIAGLPAGSAILLSNDYDPATEAELFPMTLALLTHCFRQGHRLFLMTLFPQGTGTAEKALSLISKKLGKKSGTDFVFLGYQPGGALIIRRMVKNLQPVFPKDFYGQPTKEMPVFQGITGLKNFSLMICLSGTGIVGTWIVYGQGPSETKMAAGVTAVMATELYPYLDTRQLIGMMGGLKGGAEYEVLLDKKRYEAELGQQARACAGMDGQTAAHLIIILFVLTANFLYFATRNAPAKG